MVFTSAYTQSCDTLRNYNLNDTFYEFTGVEGHPLGHEKLNASASPVMQWAEPYSVPAPTEVRRLLFVPWLVHDAGGSVTFNVYNDNAGVPGGVIGSQTVALADITEYTLTEVDFTTPVNVSGNFFVGIELTYNTPQDTIAILGTHKPGGVNFTQMFFDGTWTPVENVYVLNGTEDFISAWRLDVLTSNAPAPNADFTSNNSACLGGEFTVDGSISQNVDQYDWVHTDNPFSQIYDDASGVNATLVPTVSTGDHAIYLIADGGCMTDVVGYLVNVFDPVSATVTPTNTTCGINNGEITVTNPAGGSGNYSYSLDGVNFQTNNVFGNLAPNTYTVWVVSAGDACEETYTVTVGSTPQETITVGADQTSCTGDQVTLTASGNGAIEWFEGTNSIGTGTSITVSPNVTTTYEAVLTDANNCEDADEIIVNVNALPIVDAGADASVCLNDNIVISASGATSYTWDNGLGNGASHTVSPTTTTTYEVTGIDGNNCSNTDNVTITVEALPVIETNADGTICEGASYSISATGGASYTWDNGLGAGPSHTVSPNNTTTYTVTGTGANGCENTDNVVVTVTPLDDASFTFNNYCDLATSNGPTNVATPGGTFSFNPIPTDGATIDGTSGEITDGVAGATYTVEYVTNGSCPNSSTETVSVQSSDDPSFMYDDICLGNGLAIEPYNIATTGGSFSFVIAPTDGATIDGTTGEISSATNGSTYQVEYLTPSGVCQSSSTETIEVFNAPTVQTSADETICEQDQITISATGASSYNWDNSLGAGANHTVSPLVSTTYIVTGTDNNGCTNTDAVLVTVNSLPIVSAGTDEAICDGQSITIEATGAVTYTWDNNLGSGASHSVSPVITTTYEVIGTDNNGCENSDQVVITVNATPQVDAGLNQTGCEGDEIILTANGASTYVWDNGVTQGTPFIPGVGSVTYTVTGTAANGCEDQDQVSVEIHELPLVDAGADQAVCEGDAVTLTATVSVGTIDWDNNVVDNESFVPQNNETYTVTANNNGCFASDEVFVEVLPLPTVTAGDPQTLCLNHAPITLMGTPTGGTFSGNGIVSNEFDPELAGEGEHTITYSYEDGNGCQAIDEVVFTVEGCASLEENQLNDLITIRPNPASSYFEIVLDEATSVNDVQLISAEGRLVSIDLIPLNNIIKVATEGVQRGAYFVRIQTQDGITVKKLILH